MAAIDSHVDAEEKKRFPVDEKTLGLFWKFSEIDNETRISATIELLQALKNTKTKKLESGFSPELKYSIKRLVAGLASSRKAARHGFYLALVEILHHFDNIEGEYIHKLLMESFNQDTKEEKKNSLIGMLLGFCALARSEKDLTDAVVVDIVNFLMSTIAKKKDLELFCIAIMNELLSKLDEQQFERTVFPALEETLKCGWDLATPWHVWLLLKVHMLFKNIIDRNFLSQHWENSSLMNKSRYARIGQIMMQSTSVHPHVHPVCLLMTEKARKSKMFSKFWHKAIDGVVVRGQKEKTYLAFELTKIILPQLTSAQQVKAVLQRNLVRSFVNNLRRKHFMLHAAALHFAAFLVEYVIKLVDPLMQFTVIHSLLKMSGTLMFDKNTNTKTISNMSLKLKDPAIKLLCEFLIDEIHTPTFSKRSSSRMSNEEWSFALQMITRLLNQLSTEKDYELQEKIFKFFFLHGFFDIQSMCSHVKRSNAIKDNVDKSLRSSFCENFFRGLNVLSQVNHSKTTIHHYCEVLYGIINFAQSLLMDKCGLQILSSFEDEARICWNKMFASVNKLRSLYVKENDGSPNKVFQVLLMQMGLQLFVEPKETVPILDELFICCSKSLYAKGNRIDEGDEHPWIEVTVDLLVGLLSRNQHLLRVVVVGVFSLLSPYVTPKAMKQILDVIDPTRDSDDEGPLMEETLSSDADESIECDDEEHAEAEMDVDEQSSDSSDEEIDEMEAKDKVKVSDELRLAVQNALGDNMAGSDKDLSDVDEDELNRLDEALAEVFKSHKKKLSQNTETLTHFRIRCVDLVESVITNHPTLPVISCTVLPLVSTLRFSAKNKDQKPLYNRIIALIKKMILVKKFYKSDAKDEWDDSLENWKQLISKVAKAPSSELATVVAQLMAFLASALIMDNQENNEMKSRIYSLYSNHLEQFLQQKQYRLSEYFFIYFMTKQSEFCEVAAPILLDSITNKETSVFKKTKALNILRCHIINKPEISDKLSEKNWRKYRENLANYITEVLQDVHSKSDIKPLFMKELLSLHESFTMRHKENGQQNYPLISIEVLSNALPLVPTPVKRLIRRIMMRGQAPDETITKKQKLDKAHADEMGKKRKKESVPDF